MDANERESDNVALSDVRMHTRNVNSSIREYSRTEEDMSQQQQRQPHQHHMGNIDNYDKMRRRSSSLEAVTGARPSIANDETIAAVLAAAVATVNHIQPSACNNLMSSSSEASSTATTAQQNEQQTRPRPMPKKPNHPPHHDRQPIMTGNVDKKASSAGIPAGVAVADRAAKSPARSPSSPPAANNAVLFLLAQLDGATRKQQQVAQRILKTVATPPILSTGGMVDNPNTPTSTARIAPTAAAAVTAFQHQQNRAAPAPAAGPSFHREHPSNNHQNMNNSRSDSLFDPMAISLSAPRNSHTSTAPLSCSTTTTSTTNANDVHSTPLLAIAPSKREQQKEEVVQNEKKKHHYQQDASRPLATSLLLPRSKISHHLSSSSSSSSSSMNTIKSIILYSEYDEFQLSPYQCLVRKQIELFEQPFLALPNEKTTKNKQKRNQKQQQPSLSTTTTTGSSKANMMMTMMTSRGRKRLILPGQVGIRCRHCAKNHTVSPSSASPSPPPVVNRPQKQQNKQRTTTTTRMITTTKYAVLFPSSLMGLYQLAQNMANSHLLETCTMIPDHIRHELFQKRSREKGKKTCKSAYGGGRRYWATSLQELNVIETSDQRLWFSSHDPSSSSRS